MAGMLGNPRKAEALDYALGGAAPAAAPATVWVALVTDSNTDAQRANGTFTEVTTTNWTDYARAAVTNNATNFPAASTNTGTGVVTKSNGTAISFTSTGGAHVTGTGPTPTGFVILDSASLSAAANVVATGSLTSGNVPVVNGNNVNYAIGALVATLV